jgi:hypothetical protein
MDGRKITLIPGATLRFGFLGFVYTGPAESVVGRTFTQPLGPNVLTGAVGHEAFVRGFSDETIIGMLGPNPRQERFRLAAYYLTDLAFQTSGDEPLGWGEFMERYTAMYPHGQPGLPDDPVTAYVNNLRATGAALGSTTTRRARAARRHDPTQECNVCVTSASSSSEPEPTLCHRAADAQGGRGSTNSRRRGASSTRSWPFFTRSWAWMPSTATDDLHNTFLCRRGPARGTTTDASAVQLLTNHTAVHQRRRAHAPAHDNNRRANEGANVDANTDAPPLFQRAS